ncbi:KinB sensor domain-containing domain [Pseudomonas jinjuensis]|uniref:KinB sensor domain-containing domain n=1 Tax=Pseudomonas jinjuensis TaxID=198616 RepID=UPI0009FD3736|nr:KinB sensor domain-containing domain [Pseudomonas jinjuensis]
MPIAMTLRTRLFLSFSALITVALLGLLLGLFSVMQTGREQERSITQNFTTIEVSQQLRKALGDQLMLILSDSPDPARLDAAQQHFRQVLQQGYRQSGDETERQAYSGIEAANRTFLKDLALVESSGASLLDDQDLARSADDLRHRLQELHQYALENIKLSEARSRQRAWLSAGLLGLVGIAILLIGFITAHSIARRFGAPIETMAKAADKIGQGDFDVTLPISTVSEMASLIRRFGLMAEALRQYKATNVEALDYGRKRLQAVLDSISDGMVIIDRHGCVEHANPVASQQLFPGCDPHGKEVGALLDNPELSQATLRVLHGESLEETPRDLEREIDGENRVLAWSMTPVTHDDGRNMGAVMVVRDVTELRNFERVRNEFVLRASHELRTPVTGMHMAFGLLRERLEFPAESRELDLVRTVDEEMSRLVRLINDLLNFSRYQSGLQKLDRRPCDLPELLGEVRKRFGELAENKQIRLELELEDELPAMKLDSLQFERVLDNLLDNALRHTPSGGEILLQARRQGERVAVAVTDSGEGIPYSQQGRIFEPFVQVGRKKGGVGLGLALCKEIVQLHGGRIAVHSQPGKGTRFSILLPV